MNWVKKFVFILRDAIVKFSDDRGVKLSASLSYYTIFSLAPLLIIITTVTGVFYGKEAMQGKIYYQIQGMVGKEAALQVQQAIQNTVLDNNSHWATIVSIIALILGATGVFTEIQDSINIIWGLKTKPKKGFIKLIINRIISFGMILSIGFLLMVSLILNGVIDFFNERIQQFFPKIAVVTFVIINELFMLIVITSLFATIFKVLPDGKVKWKDVIIGSTFTAILFMTGKYLIGLYLGNSNVATAYGAAGSVVIIMLWVYYSSIIVFIGAEFTQVYTTRYGKPIKPNNYAVLVQSKEIELHTESNTRMPSETT